MYFGYHHSPTAFSIFWKWNWTYALVAPNERCSRNPICLSGETSRCCTRETLWCWDQEIYWFTGPHLLCQYNCVPYLHGEQCSAFNLNNASSIWYRLWQTHLSGGYSSSTLKMLDKNSKKLAKLVVGFMKWIPISSHQCTVWEEQTIISLKLPDWKMALSACLFAGSRKTTLCGFEPGKWLYMTMLEGEDGLLRREMNSASQMKHYLCLMNSYGMEYT